MKKCKDCNIEMIEDTNLHTDYVGGVKFEEQIYVDFNDEVNGVKPLLKKKIISTQRVKARVCPNCGQVELYVDLMND